MVRQNEFFWGLGPVHAKDEYCAGSCSPKCCPLRTPPRYAPPALRGYLTSFVNMCWGFVGYALTITSNDLFKDCFRGSKVAPTGERGEADRSNQLCVVWMVQFWCGQPLCGYATSL